MKEKGITFRSAEMKGPVLFKEPKPGPCVLVIFGATGDLFRKKLMPALYNLEKDGLLPDELKIVGYSHTERTTEEFITQMMEEVEKVLGKEALEDATKDKFAGRLIYFPGDFSDIEGFMGLRELLSELEKESCGCSNRLFYLAIPPSFIPFVIENLGGANLVHPGADTSEGPWTRVVIEKPFGKDLASARELNDLVSRYLKEEQIYRVDHYLGKETVQNILVFRFANSIFEPIWNRKYIDHVQITASEDIGIGGRGTFYDETGVVRDVIQNHLMQVLSMVAMESPVSFNAKEIRDEKAKLFRSIQPITMIEVPGFSVFGQYEGYRNEPNVSPDSMTSTYVAIKLYIDNWRWQGVPFYIRAGKRLSRKLTEVSIHFTTPPVCLFGGKGVCQYIRPNVLCIRIQPDEGITMSFSCKEPGDQFQIQEVTMDFSYVRAFQKRSREAYERLFLDCLRGDQTLFSRQDAVELEWAFVEPFLKALEQGKDVKIYPYKQGSLGPKEADDFIIKDGRAWRPIK